VPEGLNSNLNLNEGAPPRVRPAMGEWGPNEVPTTGVKRRQRWFAIGAIVVVLAVVVTYGYFMWQALS
jgi:hypothetical protein